MLLSTRGEYLYFPIRSKTHDWRLFQAQVQKRLSARCKNFHFYGGDEGYLL